MVPAKKLFWKLITPIFPYGRDFLLWIGFLKHGIRQPFLLGKLAPGRTAEGLQEFMKQHGFGNHFIAWVDTDEVLGMRKLVSFEWQYHLRVFSDNEVRGHYEYTPESHPFKHFYEIGMVPRREEFLAFLGDWIVPNVE